MPTIWILIYLFILVYTQEIQMFKVSKEVNYTSCLEELISHYRPRDKELLITNFRSKFLNSRERLTVDLQAKHLPKVHERRLCYLLDLREKLQLDNFIRHLRKRRRWFHSRARLGTNYVFLALLVDEDLRVSTYNPFKYENINEPNTDPIDIGYCATIRPVLGVINLMRYPLRWRNSTVNVFFRKTPPFANENFTGSEQRLYLESIKAIEAKPIVFLGENKFEGVEVNDSYQNKGLELLHEGKVQIVSGGFQSDADFYHKFDNSPVFAVDSLNFFTPKALRRSDIEAWLRISTSSFQCLWVLSGIIWVLLIKLLYKENTFTLCFIAFRLLLQSPLPKLERYKRLRVPLGSLLLGLFFLNSIVTTTLQEAFSSTLYKDEIHTEEDVINSNLPIFVARQVFDAFNGSCRKIDKILSKKMKICAINIRECIAKVCQESSTIMIGPLAVLTSEGLNVCVDNKTGELLYHIGEEVAFTFYQVYYAKGYPLAPILNVMLQRLVLYGGVVTKEINMFNSYYDQKMANFKRNKVSSSSISYEYMSGVLIVYLAQLAAASVILIAEILVDKWQRKKKKTSKCQCMVSRFLRNLSI